MNKTFWHFGDSYAFFTNKSERNFGELLADKFKCDEYYNYGLSGASNEMIFSNIIKKSNNFKKNDIVFINWSFVSRTSYASDNPIDIKSTNEYVDDYIKKITHDNNDIFDFLKKYSYIVEYLLYNNYDITTKLFLGLVNPFIASLIERGVVPISLFIEENAKLHMNKTTIYEFNKINILPPNTAEIQKIKPINPTSFISYLEVSGFHNEENGHYTNQSQQDIFDTIYCAIQNSIKNI